MAVSKVLLALALLSAVEAGSPCGTVAPKPPPTAGPSPCTTATQPPNTCATYACPAGFVPKGGVVLCGNAHDEKCCTHRCCNIVTTVTTTPKTPCSTVTTTPGTTVTTRKQTPCSTVTTTPGTTVTTTPKTPCSTVTTTPGTTVTTTKQTPCSTVTTTPGTTVTTTPKAPCSTVTTTPGTTVTTTKKTPCSTVTTTPGTTVTTTPPPPTCASFKCGAGSLPKNPALVCANRKCSEEQCCAKNPCAPQNIPKQPPAKVVAPPASPCGTVAPARKYDAKDPIFAQEVSASKKDASVVPAWAFPFFGVLAMFSCSAFIAIRARRARRSDAWTLLSDEADLA